MPPGNTFTMFCKVTSPAFVPTHLQEMLPGISEVTTPANQKSTSFGPESQRFLCHLWLALNNFSCGPGLDMLQKTEESQARWFTRIIPPPERLRQEAMSSRPSQTTHIVSSCPAKIYKLNKMKAKKLKWMLSVSKRPHNDKQTPL